MRKCLYLLISVFTLAACTSPKYTYNFDYYNYNSGKKKATINAVAEQSAQESILAIDETTLVASANETEVYAAKPTPILTKAEASAKLKSMSREEKKELKRELKKYVKESKRSSTPNENAAQSLNGDVKLAAIFGAIGLVLLIIGGDALSIIGGLSLLVGLFFLIRYLVNQ